MKELGWAALILGILVVLFTLLKTGDISLYIVGVLTAIVGISYLVGK